MNQFVANNAAWVNKYDNKNELQMIINLLKQLDIPYQNDIRIVDVGCGSGRSSKCIQKAFPRAVIDAIDINSDCIEFALNSRYDNINFICVNAFDFFNSAPKYDLVFFVWSLFDTVGGLSRDDKNQKLDLLFSNIKNCLSENGHIIILQPTKGGCFEKILSIFMPDSDEENLFIHEYLINKGFYGPQTPFPSIDEPYAIWSKFICNQEELFNGVSSILMLEAKQLLAQDRFNCELEKFISIHCVKNNNLFYLSDCVNLYYF